MAFSARPIDKVPNNVGARKITVGKWSNDGGTTGGDIDTGLRICESLQLQSVDTGIGTSRPIVSAATAFPLGGSKINITTAANQNGLYVAQGR